MSQGWKHLQPIQICPCSLCKDDFMLDGPVSCWIWPDLKSWPLFIFHIHVSHWNWGGGQRQDMADEETWWSRFSTVLPLGLCLCCYKRVGRLPVEPCLRGRQREETTSCSFCLVQCHFQKLKCLPSARDHSLLDAPLSCPKKGGKNKNRLLI